VKPCRRTSGSPAPPRNNGASMGGQCSGTEVPASGLACYWRGHSMWFLTDPIRRFLSRFCQKYMDATTQPDASSIFLVEHDKMPRGRPSRQLSPSASMRRSKTSKLGWAGSPRQRRHGTSGPPSGPKKPTNRPRLKATPSSSPKSKPPSPKAEPSGTSSSRSTWR
jgi:hypothetical protein